MKKKTGKTEQANIPSDVSQLEGWTKARWVADPTEVRIPAQRITINIDSDIIAIFKTEALHGGPPYQVAINQALRRYLRDREESDQEHASRVVLAALDHPTVRRKIRRISTGASRGG